MITESVEFINIMSKMSKKFLGDGGKDFEMFWAYNKILVTFRKIVFGVRCLKYFNERRSENSTFPTMF